jgi:hypothetical protein
MVDRGISLAFIAVNVWCLLLPHPHLLQELASSRTMNLNLRKILNNCGAKNVLLPLNSRICVNNLKELLKL